MPAVRLAKIAFVLATGLFCLLVGYNNIVDYGSNFTFVQHVLAMDTTFPDNAVRASRALTDPRIHEAAYTLIILAELVIGLVCVVGAARLARELRAPAERFNAAKGTATLGLAAGVLFWFLGFMLIGAEWFQMWQSETWNGQETAFRFVATIGLFLVFLSLEDR